MAAAFPLSLVIFEISNPFESVKLSACKPDDETPPLILLILICPKSESREIFDNTTPAAFTLALTPSMAMDLILNFPPKISGFGAVDDVGKRPISLWHKQTPGILGVDFYPDRLYYIL